jgi:hypothetical protein
MDSVLYVSHGIQIVNAFLGLTASEWTALSTFLILVATGIYASITYNLWTNQRDSFIISNNPIIGLTKALKLDSMRNAKDEFIIAYHYTNYGKTAASKVEFYVRATLDKSFIEEEFVAQHPIIAQPPHVMMPGQLSHNIIHIPVPQGLSSYNAYRLVKMGKMPLLIRLEFYYWG